MGKLRSSIKSSCLRVCARCTRIAIWPLPAILVLILAAGVLAPAGALAQLGSRTGKEWIERLERPERIAGLRIDQVLARLKLKPGAIVADIGAGSGAFSLPLARAVAPNGKVYAVDVDQELLDYIKQKAAREKINNIQTVKGEFTDPKLPARDVDLAFFHDVLHHVEKREEYLKALASYMKPGARLALIEMNPHDPGSPHRRHGAEMLLEKEQVSRWLAGLGFTPRTSSTCSATRSGLSSTGAVRSGGADQAVRRPRRRAGALFRNRFSLR